MYYKLNAEKGKSNGNVSAENAQFVFWLKTKLCHLLQIISINFFSSHNS